MSPIAERQFIAVRRKWPGAVLSAWSDYYGDLLSVPDAKLFHPEAWSKPRATIAMVLPPGWPQASPNLFYFDSNLTLAHGGPPERTINTHPIPGFTQFYTGDPYYRVNDPELLFQMVNFLRVHVSNLGRAQFVAGARP